MELPCNFIAGHILFIINLASILVVLPFVLIYRNTKAVRSVGNISLHPRVSVFIVRIFRIDCCHPLFGILFALGCFFTVAFGVWLLPCASDKPFMMFIVNFAQWMLLGFWDKSMLLLSTNPIMFMGAPGPFLVWTGGPFVSILFWQLDLQDWEKAWFCLLCCIGLACFLFAKFTDQKEYCRCSPTLIIDVALVGILSVLIGTVETVLPFSTVDIAFFMGLRLLHLWTWLFGRMLVKLWKMDKKNTRGFVHFLPSKSQLEELKHFMHVDLCYNRIGQEQLNKPCEALNKACEALKMNKDLVSVDFEANLITDEDPCIEELRSLLISSSIKELNLRANLITKAGALKIRHALFEQKLLRNIAPKTSPGPWKEIETTTVLLDPDIDDVLDLVYQPEESDLLALLSNCIRNIPDPAQVLIQVLSNGTLTREMLERRVSGSTLLHVMVQKETLKLLIPQIERNNKGILATTTNENGVNCFDGACAEVTRQLDLELSFRRKFRPLSVIPEHQSATCAVFRAIDGNDSRDRVVLKLMKNTEQFRQELSQRDGLDPAFVVPWRWKDDAHDFEDAVAKTFGLRGYYCGFSMPAADRDLMTIFLKERISPEVMQDLTVALAAGLGHLHSKGKVHGDMKPANVVGFRSPAESKNQFAYSFKLIDFDACVQVGTLIDLRTSKTSTAYCPPEMFLKDARVYASPTFDLWSLGVILFRAFAHQPLVEADDRDNLRNDHGAQTLANWGPKNQGNALRLMSAAMRDDAVRDERGEENITSRARRLCACDLVGSLLFREPAARPQTATSVLSHAMLVGGGTLYMSIFHLKAGMGEEIKEIPPDCMFKDVLGRSPLHLAAENGHVNIVESLIATHPILIDAKDFLQNSPLQSLLHLIDAEPASSLIPAYVTIVARLGVQSKMALLDGSTPPQATLAVGRRSSNEQIRNLFESEMVIVQIAQALRSIPAEPFDVIDFNAKNNSKLEQAVWDMLDTWGLTPARDEAESKAKRIYLQKYIWPLAMWKREEAKEIVELNVLKAETKKAKKEAAKTPMFKKLQALNKQKMQPLLEKTYQIRNNMLAEPEGGKNIAALEKFGDPVRTDIRAANVLLEHLANPGSAISLQRVDEEVLVPFIRIMAEDLRKRFEESLEECLENTPSKARFSDHVSLPQHWTRFKLVAPVKEGKRMIAKVGEIREEDDQFESWPHSSNLGDTLRATVVCRSAAMVYQTWESLNLKFKVKDMRGRLKNNFKTAGIGNGAPQPPDMLMNAMMKIGNTSLAVEIQIHHFDILQVKELDLHLLYEIQRAANIDALYEK